MRRGLDGLQKAIGIAIVLWAGAQWLGQLGEPTVAVDRELLPRSERSSAGSGRVGQLSIESPRRGTATLGTAWHAGDGVWLSNRHVVEGCSRAELGSDGIDAIRVHPDADLAAAMSRTERGAVPLAAAAPERGQRGLAVGYPQGEAGLVELSLRAEQRLVLTGSLDSERPFRYKVWAIRDLPDHVDNAAGLGGISGGVVLVDPGEAVGVIFAGNSRRGTAFSIPFAEVSAAVAGMTRSRPGATEHAQSDLREFAEELLYIDWVARVYCKY